jgi:hypothetical protein
MGFRGGLGALGNSKSLLHESKDISYRSSPISPYNESDIRYSDHAIPAPITPSSVKVMN